jgi:hypothetical protein
MASDTSLVFNIIAKDNASGKFNKLKGIAIASFAAVGAAAIKFGIDSVKAYTEAETAQAQLQDAFDRFPKLADTNIGALRNLNTALMQKTKFDDDAIASSQALLGRFNLTGKQITELTPLLLDYAAKTGKDLPAAATALGKGFMGSGRAMKELGINFKDAGSVSKNYAQIMTGLRDKVGGFAEKEGKTAAGRAQILKNRFGELQEKAGSALVPALEKLIGPLSSIVDFMDRNGKTVLIVVGVLGTLVGIVWAVNAAVKAYTAVQIALNIAMSLNPIGLIIIAIAALIAIIVLIATKTKFFQTIWAHVWGFLKGVGAWFAGPFVNYFKRVWQFLVSSAENLWHRYVTGWGKIITFFKGLPGKITSAAKNMWNGLVSSFKGAINIIIRAWNAIDFGINVSIPSWVPGIGGKGFNVPDIVPDIPYLAEGGIVKARRGGTAIVAGEGREDEVVAPLSRLGSLGGGRVAHVVFRIDGGDPELRRWLRRVIRSDGSTTVTFADGGLA